MGLNKPEQDLKRDLQGVASDLKWSAVELLRVAERQRSRCPSSTKDVCRVPGR